MKKAAIRVKNEEHGKKVIEYLKSIGGKNNNNFRGAVEGAYYFVDPDNRIWWASHLPDGYTEITLFEEKTFPRKMWVWDEAREKEKQIVHAIVPTLKYGVICESYGDSILPYKYAAEIEESEEMTLEQVCKELGRDIKIVKR